MKLFAIWIALKAVKPIEITRTTDANNFKKKKAANAAYLGNPMVTY